MERLRDQVIVCAALFLAGPHRRATLSLLLFSFAYCHDVATVINEHRLASFKTLPDFQ
jgi:hypothetical protein